MSEPTTIRALKIIYKLEGLDLTPRSFAEAVWPPDDERWRDSWRRSSPAGPHGSTQGGGMWRLGGSFLGKLKKAGLIEERVKYFKFSAGSERYFKLTEAGKQRLKDWEAHHRVR